MTEKKLEAATEAEAKKMVADAAKAKIEAERVKALKTAKAEFGLAVSIIMRQERCSRADASAWAFMEGPNGLAGRLGEGKGE